MIIRNFLQLSDWTKWGKNHDVPYFDAACTTQDIENYIVSFICTLKNYVAQTKVKVSHRA
jgi:hypothetical protein